MKNVILFVFLLGFLIKGICQSTNNDFCGEPDKIKDYLLENGYFQVGEIDSILGKYEEEKDLRKVEDYTKLIISYQGHDTTLFDLVKSDIKRALDDGLLARGFITENKSFCDDQILKKITNDFNTEDLDCAIYAHIWESDVSNKKYILFIKIKEATWDVLRRNHPVSRIDSLTRYFNLEAANIHPKKEYSSKFKFLPLEHWEEGMRFLIDDSDERGNTYFYKYQNSESKFNVRESVGEIFTFKRHEEREVKITELSHIRSLLIFEQGGQEYEYIDRKHDYSDLDQFRSIDNLVYIDNIEIIRKDLLDKDLYLLVDFAKEYDENNEEVRDYNDYYPNYSKLDKFSKIRIEKIEYGIQSSGSVKIWFTVEGKKNRFCHYVSFSQINQGIGFGGKILEEIFMFENPKLYYNFSDRIWDMIINREIEIGMSMEAVRLSQGTPFGAVKSTQDSKEYQIWNYGSHKVLFENSVVIETE